jgi:hypothetical protein
MASGKQTSFQFGEVSPSLRFRSDAVSFTNGLSKLKNMYVRRAGGVSNRAGMRVAKTLDGIFQKPGSSDFYTEDEILDVVFYYFKSETSFINEIACIKTENVNLLYYNRNLITKVKYELLEETVIIKAPDPSRIRFTYTKDGVFVTPSCSFEGTSGDLSKDSANIMISFSGEAFVFTRSNFLNLPGATITSGWKGFAPFLPAAYLVTATLLDGTEKLFFNIGNTQAQIDSWDKENPPSGGMVHPTSQVSVNIKIKLTANSALADIKFFNLYRSSTGLKNLNSFFKLVSRHVYDGATLEFSISDFGVESLSETAPLDTSFFGSSVTALFFKYAENAVYYQQRLITGVSSIFTENTILKPGDAIVSKLGAPKQFVAPIISNDIEAFLFSAPVEDRSPIVGWLSMERLIAFTENAVYIIRGGEQGALTPSTINPVRISQDGCASDIEPKMSGRRGYFINRRKTKLMTVEFKEDTNIVVYEVSLFSEHLLEKNITQIEAIPGIEDTIYIVTEDGKLIRVTVTDDGAHGFSTIETRGNIKRVFKYGNTLRLLVERNGRKFVEDFQDRFDKEKDRDKQFFADASLGFGFKINSFTNNGEYIRYIDGISPIFRLIDFNFKANIEPNDPALPTWEAGNIIKIRTTGEILDPQYRDNGQEFQLHFYYENVDKQVQTLRYIPDFSSEVATGDPVWTHEHSGYFLSDVPESLRDVKNQNISDREKLSRHTRFVPAVNFIPDRFNILANLFHATGESGNNAAISVYADGEVISSPNHPNHPVLYLEKQGADVVLTLGDYFAYGHIGIPYECEFETLDLETAGERTVTDAKKLINAVGIGLMETRGGFAGIPEQTLENMTPIVTREDESFNNQTKNFNGHIVVHIPTEWNEPGRATIKHVDPTPISILSVYPKGLAGD